ASRASISIRRARSACAGGTAYASLRCLRNATMRRAEGGERRGERQQQRGPFPSSFVLHSSSLEPKGEPFFSLAHSLALGAILFAIAVIGIFLNRKNMIVLLMAIELMLLAVNLNFVAFSHFFDDPSGQVFVFFILTVAAAESAIGLAILVVLFRNLNTINVEDLDSLKG